MSSYGRNFGFRIPPDADDRGGRYANGDTALPIGAPVKIDLVEGVNALGLQVVQLATGAQAPALSGAGIIVYEYGPAAFAGDDPNLVLFSDKDTAPAGAAVQLVHGPGVKVWLTNTDNTAFDDFTANFDHSTARVMVAGLGATPTVTVGDYLTPGTGNNTAGYWAETGSASNAWLRVTRVEYDRHSVEAEMLF